MQHEWRWWSEESSSVLKTLLLTICALDNPSQPLWKQQDSFQRHSSEHFVWLCYVSTHISRSSRIWLLCQAPGSRSHCNCRLFSPPAPRVAFKREKSFFVPQIPQIILRVPSFFPLVTFCRRAKLADWRRLGGFCESERLISSAICWAENFFGTRELRKPEPATLLNSWFAGFPLDLLVLPHQPHTIQNILRKTQMQRTRKYPKLSHPACTSFLTNQSWTLLSRRILILLHLICLYVDAFWRNNSWL